ncbi:MAG: transglycosylase domain-containing protein [Paucibacter sp.]|nr:transglycosylase domain-containing protein [Roseateles sp.]
MKPLVRTLLRLIVLLVSGILALQLYFAARIALMNVVAPQSTSFQRSEAWRLATQTGRIEWSQKWVDDKQGLSKNLMRAVIASEDAGFVEHGGIEWEALEKAWARNQREELRVEKRVQATKAKVASSKVQREPKVIGGSTISQQLAKNLFLSGERNLARKGQEFIITLMLETLLSKQRILEIYLNNVEWGEGVFGAQAAARHYFHIDAKQLSPAQAARLAVMLPAPKRFEKRPASPYVVGRAGTIEARMGAVELP